MSSVVCPLVPQFVRYRPPDAHRLVRFAGVGLKDVLESRFDGLGHVGVRNGNEVVVNDVLPSA